MVETTKDNKEIILDIISEAFKNVKNAYDLSNEPNSSKDSRLIFPNLKSATIIQYTIKGRFMSR